MMRTRVAALIWIAVLVFSRAGHVFAADAPKARTAKSFDKDKDGSISDLELQDILHYHVPRNCAQFPDGNLDGRISEQEAAAYRHAVATDIRNLMTTYGGGRLTLEAADRVFFASRDTVERFDRDGNSRLDAAELRAFAEFHRTRTSKAKPDEDHDGEISEAERSQYRVDIDHEVEELLAGYPEGSVAVGEANRTYYGKAVGSPLDFWGKTPVLSGLLVRRSYDDTAIYAAVDAGFRDQAFKKADSALVSYSRDFLTGGDTWQIRASLMYPFRVTGSGRTDEGFLSSLILMPSVSLERVTNEENRTKDVNSLIPRVTAEFVLNDLPVEDSQVLARLGFSYGTDVDIESKVTEGRLEIEPVITFLGGTGFVDRPIGAPYFEYALRPILVATYGHVHSAPQGSKLESGDSHIRVGPKIQLDILPTAPELAAVSFGFSYQALYAVTGTPKKSALFEAKAALGLDAKGHVSLEIAFRNGDTPLVEKRTHLLTIGLGIKF